jgi:hypothetical protein
MEPILFPLDILAYALSNHLLIFDKKDLEHPVSSLRRQCHKYYDASSFAEKDSKMACPYTVKDMIAS